MSRLKRDLLSLASCGTFVWMIWQVSFLVA